MSDMFKKETFTIYGNKIIISKNKYEIIGTTVTKFHTNIRGWGWGWGCGYVIVGPNHPAFGLEYPEEVSVHGGITFSQELKDGEFNGIYAEHGWIFGFDTGHYNDSIKSCSKRYVISETLSLAKQMEKYGEIY